MNTEHAELAVPKIDIILPVYNEDENVHFIYDGLLAALEPLGLPFRLIFVDDGSDEPTQTKLASLMGQDSRVEVVELSRNFGHQAALTAGLDYSTADIVIMMDADGQHPPELIPEMLKLHQAGYDIVYTQRVDEKRTPLLKRLPSRIFYGLLNQISGTKITPGSADFRLVSRNVVDAIGQMREYHRFLRGMFSWIGFRSVILPFSPPERFSGRSKYSLRKMVGLALNAGFSFSLVPLYIASFIGILFLLLSVAEIIYVMSFWVRGLQHTLAPGWSSLMFVLLFVGGILLSILGIIGLYVGYIFQEVKGRPIYIVRSDRKGGQAEMGEPR